ncbi:hypothetical protein Tco_1522887 [Tanacetum coccineum]
MKATCRGNRNENTHISDSYDDAFTATSKEQFFVCDTGFVTVGKHVTPSAYGTFWETRVDTPECAMIPQSTVACYASLSIMAVAAKSGGLPKFTGNRQPGGTSLPNPRMIMLVPRNDDLTKYLQFLIRPVVSDHKLYFSTLQKDGGTTKAIPSFHRDLETRNAGWIFYYSVEQKRKSSDSLQRRVRSRVADRHLPTHRMAIQNAGTNNISNEGSENVYYSVLFLCEHEREFLEGNILPDHIIREQDPDLFEALSKGVDTDRPQNDRCKTVTLCKRPHDDLDHDIHEGEKAKK